MEVILAANMVEIALNDPNKVKLLAILKGIKCYPSLGIEKLIL